MHTATVDGRKLEALLGRSVVEVGATFNAALVLIGERLGLYKALARLRAATAAELAEATGTKERYVREWLSAQAAGGFVEYDASAERFALSPEQTIAFADENSPTYMPGAFQVALAAVRAVDQIEHRFRNGNGFGWHEHHPELFEGTERFFRPGYAANLVSSWIPALEGVEEKLRRGGLVADVGCGHGASTLIMAEAYPASTFVGFDYHAASVSSANERASRAGLADRVRFEVAAAKTFPGQQYDLVTFFDALHDMGDPVGTAHHVRESLAPDGTWMLVEPYAGDKLEDNLNPVGRLFYCASTLVCTPNALNQDVGLALGAQAGEARLRDVVERGGFRSFRRAAHTPFNLVFEARP